MSVGRTLALVAALIAVLAGGIWLGGHPGKLPPPIRDAFVDESGGLTAEATELIEDNYFREVSEPDLINSSLSGMARGLRRRYHDRFSEYFSPELLAKFNEAIAGKFSGIGLTVIEVKRGLQVEKVFKGSPAEAAGIEPGDVIVSVDGHEIAGVSSTKSTELIKGAGRDRGHRRRAQGRARQAPGADPDQGPDLGPGRRQHRARIRRAGSSVTSASRPSARGRTRRCAGRSKRSGRKGPKACSSTCAATAAACSRRRSSTPASSCPRARSW